jgi:hypothetical protein
MVLTLFERFLNGFRDGLASYRGGFGTVVLRSDRLREPDFPIICPYLPPSGILFGLASPLLMPLRAIFRHRRSTLFSACQVRGRTG